MKAIELMIGDWVKFPGGAIEKIVDLPYIAGKGLCASFSASATLFPFPVDQLNPVKITPEILKKNGFVIKEFFAELRISDEWRIIHDGIFLVIYHKDKISFGNPAGHVNELQHALRQCKIEREIEL